MDDSAPARFRLGIAVAGGRDHDLQLRRFYGFLGHLFHPRLYQRKSKIKAYAGMCRGQQHLRDRRHRDHLHDDSGMDQRVTGGDA